jgi:hypothetical protein
MTAMPERTDESPPLQEDRDRQPGATPRDEPRNSASDGLEAARNDDAAGDDDFDPDDPGINTHGSER